MKTQKKGQVIRKARKFLFTTLLSFLVHDDWLPLF